MAQKLSLSFSLSRRLSLSFCLFYSRTITHSQPDRGEWSGCVCVENKWEHCLDGGGGWMEKAVRRGHLSPRPLSPHLTCVGLAVSAHHHQLSTQCHHHVEGENVMYIGSSNALGGYRTKPTTQLVARPTKPRKRRRGQKRKHTYSTLPPTPHTHSITCHYGIRGLSAL